MLHAIYMHCYANAELLIQGSRLKVIGTNVGLKVREGLDPPVPPSASATGEVI